MTPHLNTLQSAQLLAVVAAFQRDLREGFTDSSHAPHRIAPFPCGVPDMACVSTHDGITLALLYPCERPVPRDPLFQHAESLLVHERSLRSALMLLHSAPAWRRDWQANEGAAMDAPDRLPAGACVEFAASDDAYGAYQVTCLREPD